MSATSFPMPPLLDPIPGYDEFSLTKFLTAPSANDEARLSEACHRYYESTLSLVQMCEEYVGQASSRSFPWNCGLWMFNPRYFESSVSV